MLIEEERDLAQGQTATSSSTIACFTRTQSLFYLHRAVVLFHKIRRRDGLDDD